jgi:hypothetical protein
VTLGMGRRHMVGIARRTCTEDLGERARPLARVLERLEDGTAPPSPSDIRPIRTERPAPFRTARSRVGKPIRRQAEATAPPASATSTSEARPRGGPVRSPDRPDAHADDGFDGSLDAE